MATALDQNGNPISTRTGKETRKFTDVQGKTVNADGTAFKAAQDTVAEAPQTIAEGGVNVADVNRRERLDELKRGGFTEDQLRRVSQAGGNEEALIKEFTGMNERKASGMTAQERGTEAIEKKQAEQTKDVAADTAGTEENKEVQDQAGQAEQAAPENITKELAKEATVPEAVAAPSPRETAVAGATFSPEMVTERSEEINKNIQEFITANKPQTAQEIRDFAQVDTKNMSERAAVERAIKQSFKPTEKEFDNKLASGEKLTSEEASSPEGQASIARKTTNDLLGGLTGQQLYTVVQEGDNPLVVDYIAGIQAINSPQYQNYILATENALNLATINQVGGMNYKMSSDIAGVDKTKKLEGQIDGEGVLDAGFTNILKPITTKGDTDLFTEEELEAFDKSVAERNRIVDDLNKVSLAINETEEDIMLKFPNASRSFINAKVADSVKKQQRTANGLNIELNRVNAELATQERTMNNKRTQEAQRVADERADRSFGFQALQFFTGVQQKNQAILREQAKAIEADNQKRETAVLNAPAIVARVDQDVEGGLNNPEIWTKRATELAELGMLDTNIDSILRAEIDHARKSVGEIAFADPSTLETKDRYLKMSESVLLDRKTGEFLQGPSPLPKETFSTKYDPDTGEYITTSTVSGVQGTTGSRTGTHKPSDSLPISGSVQNVTYSNIREAITTNESGGNYGILSEGTDSQGRRALGRYQIMPYHLPTIGLDGDSPEDIQKFLDTPKLQDELFEKIIKTNIESEGGDVRRGVARYFGGSDGAKVLDTPAGDLYKDSLGTSVNSYVAQFEANAAKAAKGEEFRSVAMQLIDGSIKTSDLGNLGYKTKDKRVIEEQRQQLIDKGYVAQPSRNLPDSKAILLADAKQLPDVLSNMQSLLDDSGDLFGVDGALQQYNPFAVKTQTAAAQLRTARQLVGKFMEGGVLRAEDEVKYRAMLPDITDQLPVAQNKLKLLQDILTNKYNGYIDALEDAGFKLGGAERIKSVDDLRKSQLSFEGDGTDIEDSLELPSGSTITY